MGVRRLLSTGAFALVAVAGSTACSDDPPPVVSQDEYDDAVAGACLGVDHVAIIDQVTRADAEFVALLRTSYVPEVRSAVRRIVRVGFPAEKAGQYQTALNEVLANVDEIDDEDEAYQFLDHYRRGEFGTEGNPIQQIEEAFEAADVPCRQPPAFDPAP
jgi:hypothetical protein